MTQGGGEAITAIPRILVLSSEAMKVSSLSPFQRKEACDRLGKVTRCEKLRDGGIEVEFVKEKDAQQALSARHFTYTVKDGNSRRRVTIPMSVTAHRTKNSNRGVIFCPDLEGVSNEDIADGLSACGVVNARRILSRRAGVDVPTPNIILTFSQLDLPREVPVGYVMVRVRQYVPKPMRCFRCLRFGHTKDYCRNRPSCGKCAQNDHSGDQCTSETLKCVNCPEDPKPHSAFDQKCPALLREREVLALKYNERISFREARERVYAVHPKRSYASVCKVTGTSGQPEASQQQGNISQLIALLRSFGLKLTGHGLPPEPVTAAPCAPQPAAATFATAGTQTSPTGAGEAIGSDPGGGWTQIRGRRGSGSSRSAATRPASGPPSPQPPGLPAPAESAVMEALRRGEEERRVREAKRARLAEKARESLRSPGVDAAAAKSAPRIPMSQRTSSTERPPMGPPPLPPPPPPPPTRAADGVSTSPSTVQRFSTARPPKRSLPLEGSPTENDGAVYRQRFQQSSTGGRSSSADGRLRHTRIQYEESSFSGDAQLF